MKFSLPVRWALVIDLVVGVDVSTNGVLIARLGVSVSSALSLFTNGLPPSSAGPGLLFS